jgi:hypothetical protein
VPRKLLNPLGTGRVTETLTRTVRPVATLTRPVADLSSPVVDIARPVTRVVSPVVPREAAPVIASLSGDPTQPAGNQSASEPGGGPAAPRQRAVPVTDAPAVPAAITPAAPATMIRPAEPATVAPAAPVAVAPEFRAVSTLDSASSPVAGAASVAPALPLPAPGTVPVLPGTGLMNSGNTAGSNASQFGGSAGAIVAAAHPAAPLAPRACPFPVESVTPLVRAEELAPVPD